MKIFSHRFENSGNSCDVYVSRQLLDDPKSRFSAVRVEWEDCPPSESDWEIWNAKIFPDVCKKLAQLTGESTLGVQETGVSRSQTRE